MTHAMKKNMASMAMNPHDPTHKSTRNAHVFPCLKTGPLWAAFLEDPPDGGPADPNGPWSPGNGDIPYPYYPYCAKELPMFGWFFLNKHECVELFW